MKFIRKLWIKAAKPIFRRIFKDVDEERIDAFLRKVFERDFKDNEAVLYNSYELDFARANLSSVVEFMETYKPIITENGTLFRTHAETSGYDNPFYNPMKVVINGWLEERYVLKKEMLRYKGVPGQEDLFIFYNLGQNQKKVVANGDYGAGGNKDYHMFDANCANAITGKARALISVADTTFEDFMRDNVLYFDTEELFDSFMKILNEDIQFDDSKIIERKITVEDVLDRYAVKFYDPDNFERDMVEDFLQGLDQAHLRRLYFKNNFFEFMNEPYMEKLFIKSFTSSEQFRDPYEVPEEMKQSLEKLSAILNEFVHYNHIMMDKQYRLDKDRRKCVVVIDTDSNMLNLRQHMEFLLSKIGIDINDIEATDERRFKTVNILMSVLSDVIDIKLQTFNTDNCNCDPDAPGVTTMKNEFLFDILITSDAKKKYIANIRMQEGKLFEKPIQEFKNTDFTKPSMGGRLTKELITDLVKSEFLVYGEPNTLKIIESIDDLSSKVDSNIDDGKLDFMKSSSVKSASNYSNPMGTWNYKAVWIWNQLCPELYIELPTTVTIINTKISSLKDLAPIAEVDPEMFNKFRELYEEYRTELKNINSIAIPKGEPIPEWLKVVTDKEKIILGNLKQLNPYMGFGLRFVHKSSGSEFISNFVDIG